MLQCRTFGSVRGEAPRLWKPYSGTQPETADTDKGSPTAAAVLSYSEGKISDTVRRIIDSAIDESRRREHAWLTCEHLFLAFAQVKWTLFAEAMRDVALNLTQSSRQSKVTCARCRPAEA